MADPVDTPQRAGTRRMFAALDLRELELFVAIADAGSITHGARRAHLSLPSASGRLRAIERDIGVELVTRGRRGVTLTAAGRLLREHATAVLAQVEDMRGELSRLAEGLGAGVRLQANTSALDTFLPARLISFLRDRPQLDVDVRERPSRDVVRALALGHADLGVVASSVATGALVAEPLLDDRLVLAVAPSHPLADRRSVTYADCVAFPLIGLTENRALSEHLEEMGAPHGERSLHRVRLPSLRAVGDAVAAGLGVGVVPRRAVTAAVSQGVLATVDIDEPWARRSLLLCSSPDHRLPAPARDLREHLLDDREDR